MKPLTCSATRRRLGALHDGELPMADQIAVTSHLEWCDACASAFGELQSLRALLREAAPSRVAFSTEDDASLQIDIVARAQAEQSLSFAAMFRDMFEDMHLVYAGIGAVAAALVCAVISVGMMRAVTIDLVVPGVAGSNQNPVRLLGDELQLPRGIDEEGGFPSTALGHDGDAVYAFTAVVTREGTVTSLELLPSREPAPGLEPHLVDELLGIASRARFEPASRAGSPVAVNLVWILAHTTVRGTADGMGAPPSRARQRRSELFGRADIHLPA
jgi:hypothetical protein